MKMKVKKERFISMAQARSVLKKSSDEEDLVYEQKNALEFLDKHSPLKKKDSQKLKEDLEKIEKLRNKHIVVIMDNLPQTKDDLRVLFTKEVVSLSDKDKDRILKAVKKYT